MLLLSLNVSLAFAQNYDPFIKNSTTFFITGYNELMGVRFDSVLVAGSDSIFIPYSAFEDTLVSGSGAEECNIYSKGKSWIGFGMKQKPDGEYLFANRYNDTISIRSLAGWNDTWLFMKLNDMLFLEATISSIQSMTVNDIMDTVKVIVLQMKNANGEPVSSVWNGLECWLSKNNGFLKVPLLYYTPENTIYLTRFNIPGHTAAWYANHEIGDEVDVCQQSLNSSDCWASRYIGKVYSTDSSQITYTVLHYIKNQMNTPPFLTETYTTTSHVTYVSSDSTILCNFAGTNEPIIDTLSGKGSSLGYSYNECYQTVVSGPGETYFHCEGDYFKIPFELQDYYYKIDYCGITSLMNYFGEVAASQFNFTQHLTYYKKGALECGSSIIVGIEEVPGLPALLPAFPNPANEKVFIHLPESMGMSLTMSVINMTGAVVIGKQFYSINGIAELYIGELPAGIYQVLISDVQKSYRSRFVKL